VTIEATGSSSNYDHDKPSLQVWNSSKCRQYSKAIAIRTAASKYRSFTLGSSNTDFWMSPAFHHLTVFFSFNSISYKTFFILSVAQTSIILVLSFLS
jgi:hypothetical protein